MSKIVCAKYCGAVIELAEYEKQEDAEEFMKNPCILFYADEILDGEEDEVIYPYEMWIEERQRAPEEPLPFCEPNAEEDYELPF